MGSKTRVSAGFAGFANEGASESPVRLERSGAPVTEDCLQDGDWLREEPAVGGVSRLHASLKRHAYSRHRHDTYTIARTETGVQAFDYRGTVFRSLPGQVVVLHPDEQHDGRPATADGFSYRTLHVDPAGIADAMAQLAGRAELPFVDTPVLTDAMLARCIADAFDGPLEPLRCSELTGALAIALSRAARRTVTVMRRGAIDDTALRRGREFLDANFTRVVTAAELEHVCGESRYALAAQFRRRYGTSPYRYLLQRRLDYVRLRLADGKSLAELALQAGFADQAHMTRQFRASFGMTPRAYARLRAQATILRSRSAAMSAGDSPSA